MYNYPEPEYPATIARMTRTHIPTGKTLRISIAKVDLARGQCDSVAEYIEKRNNERPEWRYTLEE